LLCLFLRWRSHKLFAWDSLKLQSSRSQPPKYLGLQVWATHAQLMPSFFVEMDRANFLPRLASNQDPLISDFQVAGILGMSYLTWLISSFYRWEKETQKV
jgi:hypothetical protein